MLFYIPQQKLPYHKLHIFGRGITAHNFRRLS